MMNFYRLDHDRYIKGRWQLDGPVDDENRNENEFWQGEAIELRGVLKAPILYAGIALDFTMTVSAVPVFSGRLVSALRSILHSGVQWFPLQIDGYEGFQVLNTTTLVDCLDEKRSEFIKWTPNDGRPEKIGGYRMVSRLRLDPSRIPKNMHVFRLQGWRIALIVSQAFVDAILPLNPIGPKLELVT